MCIIQRSSSINVGRLILILFIFLKATDIQSGYKNFLEWNG